MVATETALAALGCFFCSLCGLSCLSQETPQLTQPMAYYPPETQEQYVYYDDTEEATIQELILLRKHYYDRLRLVDDIVERKKRETMETYMALNSITTPGRGFFPFFRRRYGPAVVYY